MDSTSITRRASPRTGAENNRSRFTHNAEDKKVHLQCKCCPDNKDYCLLLCHVVWGNIIHLFVFHMVPFSSRILRVAFAAHHY